jgi:thiol-disulfide isomerase/thioredoxin
MVISGLLNSNDSFSQTYNIKIKIKQVQDTTLTLAHRFADKTFVDTIVKINKKGIAILEGKRKLDGGIYLVILPENRFFELLISDDQEFSIEADTTDLVMKTKINGSAENQLFYDSQRFLVEKRKKSEKLKALLDKKTLSEDSTKLIQKQMDDIEKELSESWKKIVRENPNSFYAHLLNAMNGDEGVFFDNVDFSDSRLLRTEIIYNVTRRVMARDLNANKSYQEVIKNSDKLLEKARANEQVFQYVFGHLLAFYSTFYRTGMNRVFCHFVDQYVRTGQANWFDTTSIRQIEQRGDDLSAAFEGKKAHDLNMETTKGDYFRLYNIDTKYTLLFFWSTGCGHCLAAAQKIRDFYNTGKLDFEVYSVYTKKDKDAWLKFIEENKLENWINVWDSKDETNYSLYYYIVSTPVALLLDKDKNIITNIAGDEAIANLIKQLEEQKYKFTIEK